jgi:hypothetical protein
MIPRWSNEERHAMIATADEASVGIDRLRAAVRGTVALPGEAGYELSASWNLMVQLRPRAVVAAADSQDVVHTVRFAVAHGYRVAVLSVAQPLVGASFSRFVPRCERCLSLRLVEMGSAG